MIRAQTPQKSGQHPRPVVSHAPVAGTAVDGPGSGDDVNPADRTTLMTCTVPSGACELYGESTGQDVWFPLGPRPFRGIALQEGAGS